jgi:hypothetical protein
MFYVGLDIHDKRIAICVLGETGKVVRRAQVVNSFPFSHNRIAR